MRSALPLAPPTFARAHAVLGLPSISRDPRRDEVFIAALRQEFPNVVSHQALAAETPPAAPHLVLASTSSQLALSAVQADFEVRFYGDYATNIERALEFIERKVHAILGGFDAIDSPPMSIGLVSTLEFSFRDQEVGPAEHILRNHLRMEVDPGVVQDAVARVAVRLRDTYFVTMTVSNYETRTVERPILAGMSAIQLRPWEGRLEDFGINLVIDINNNLELRLGENGVPVVTDTGVRAVTRLLREVAMTAGPRFVESAAVVAAELEAVSTPS